MAKKNCKTKVQRLSAVAAMLVLTGYAAQVNAEEGPGRVMQKLQKPQAAPVIEQKPVTPQTFEIPVVKKIMVKSFRVRGNSLVSDADIKAIVAPAEGKELTLDEIRSVAELITGKYRDAGYLTANAYVPAQNIADGSVEIRIVEGTIGTITVTGNKSYHSSFITRHFASLQNTPAIHEEALERQLLLLNDYPALTVKTSLKAGAESGTTDLIAAVTDRFPIAGSLSYDNYGVKTTSKQRAVASLDLGNLITSGDLIMLRGILGLDTIDLDKLSYGRAEYLVPIGGNGLQVGAYYTNSVYAAGESLAPLEIDGDAKIAGAYASYPLVKKRDETITTRLGFEYGSIKNNVLGSLDNNDEIRKINVNVSYDKTDRYLGRNFVGFSYYQGLGSLLGGTAKGDVLASRYTDNMFSKFTLDAMRIQKLPGYNTLQARVSGQYSPDRLFMAEQFTLGGQGTIRGVNPAAISGDSGYLATIELNSSPIFPNTTVLGQKVGDTIKIALFADYGSVFTSQKRPEEKSSDDLWSLGAGARLYLGRFFSCRLDWAVPAINDRLDANNSMTYIQATVSF